MKKDIYFEVTITIRTWTVTQVLQQDGCQLTACITFKKRGLSTSTLLCGISKQPEAKHNNNNKK